MSYLYDDNLDVDSTLAAMAELTPLPAVEVRLGAVALFPPRVLHLSVVPTAELLSRHARVFEVASPGVPNPRAYHRTGRWNPHVTMARSVPRGLLGEAVDLCATYLPIEGRLETGGIEDATSGESWIAAYLP